MRDWLAEWTKALHRVILDPGSITGEVSFPFFDEYFCCQRVTLNPPLNP